MEKWFVCQGENVSGPFSTEEVKVQLKNGLVSKKSLIWGRLHPHWLPASRWVSHLQQILNQAPLSQNSEKQWHYALSGESHGPFEKDKLVQILSSLGRAHEILIWTKGMKNWAPLFEFPELLDAMGVNKREFPRASLQGQALIAGEPPQTGKLRSISEGGFSASGVFLIPGEVYSVEIQSDQLKTPLHVKAQARYRSESGHTGFKFTSLPQEAKTILVQYLRQVLAQEEEDEITQAA